MFSQTDCFRQRQQALSEAISAGKAALDATWPHRRPPAYAIQAQAEATYFQLEPAGFHPATWLCHLFHMSGEQVGKVIKWEEHVNCWSGGGDYSISGESILKDALYWQRTGLDMSRSPRDKHNYPEDEALLLRHADAIKRIEKSLMPLEDEVLRRRFEVKTLQGMQERYFDVWLAQERSRDPLGRLFHWALHDPNTPGHLACSSTPISNCDLEAFIAPRYVPIEGFERYLISLHGVAV